MSLRTRKDASADGRGGFIGRIFRFLRQLVNRSFGGREQEIVTGTAWTGSGVFAIKYVTDTTPTTFTVKGGVGTFSGITYKAGNMDYLQVTAITPAAGETVILYKD